ncbi:MAG TPA: CRTAC1 family protein, partial [Planctomycetes bacterium]|nr:CRTAC1 family protein [Planctomycetota bacterium]
RSIYKWVNSGGSFGANPLQQQIGLGSAATIDRIEVFWPTTGKVQIIEDVAADQFLEITEGVDGYRRRSLKSFRFSVPEIASRAQVDDF